MIGLNLLAWSPLDPWHLLVLMVVALLLFGKRLPEVGRSLGKGISEFKKGLRDVQDELGRENEHDTSKPRLRTPEAQSPPPQISSTPAPPSPSESNADPK